MITDSKPAAPARPTCRHTPPCPTAYASDRDAAHVISAHLPANVDGPAPQNIFQVVNRCMQILQSQTEGAWRKDSDLVIAPDVKSGAVATVGFSLLAVLWIGTTIAGWRFATTGNFASHKRWMMRSYALTAAAISLRLQIAGFGFAGFSYVRVSDFLSFSCWAPNLLLMELWLASLTLRRSQVIST